jgi:hypothetical protein
MAEQDFASIKGVLAQSSAARSDKALYQTIQMLLDRLVLLQVRVTELEK